MTRPVPKNSSQKKRRVQYSSLSNGSCGFIVTANRPTRIQQAMKEVIKILNHLSALPTDEPAPVVAGEVAAAPKDFDAELAAEVAAEQKDSSCGFKCQEVCRGVGFILLPKGMIPSQLCTRICEKVRDDKNLYIRDALRITPIDCAISPANFQAFLDTPSIIQYIVDIFSRSDDPSPRMKVMDTWRCELHRRNNSLGSKTLWLDVTHTAALGAKVEDIRAACMEDEKNGESDCPRLAQIVHQLKNDANTTCPFTINLEQPRHVIFLEINPLLIGCSIGEHFDEFLRYNLTAIAAKRDASDPKP